MLNGRKLNGRKLSVRKLNGERCIRCKAGCSIVEKILASVSGHNL